MARDVLVKLRDVQGLVKLNVEHERWAGRGLGGSGVAYLHAQARTHAHARSPARHTKSMHALTHTPADVAAHPPAHPPPFLAPSQVGGRHRVGRAAPRAREYGVRALRRVAGEARRV
jgi:homoserine kinase